MIRYDQVAAHRSLMRTVCSMLLLMALHGSFLSDLVDAGTPLCLGPVDEEVVAIFLESLGGSDNGDAQGSQETGARRVSWSELSTNAADGRFPGDLFNTVPTTRGLVLSTYDLSLGGDPPAEEGNADETSIAFGNASRHLPRLPDTPSNVVYAFFRVPGTNIPAAVRGFGAVLTDDQDPPVGLTLDLFSGAEVVGSVSWSGGDVFCAQSVPEPIVTSVRITASTVPLNGTDMTSATAVIQEFIYGEPVALPPTLPQLVLDVDANGTADALTDGILALRLLFGFTGNALTDGGVVAPDCMSCAAEEIEARFAEERP